MSGCIVNVPGIKAGCINDDKVLTGCTVVLAEEGAVGGVDVRGAAPGTRETDLLQPLRMVESIQAVFLSGGSAYGLDAAAGVMGFLEERGKGIQAGSLTVPLVSAAVIFDLYTGESHPRPDREMGYRACEKASSDTLPQGSVGAGAGATAGKALGWNSCIKTGQGTASRKAGNIIVGALAVVNPYGDIFDREGRQIAGPISSRDGSLLNTANLMLGGDMTKEGSFVNTTLVVVATNAGLTKEGANKVAQMAHDGLARSIWPVHTLWDGDTVFALSTGNEEADWNLVGVLGAEVTRDAVESAVLNAVSVGDIPSYQHLKKHKHKKSKTK